MGSQATGQGHISAGAEGLNCNHAQWAGAAWPSRVDCRFWSRPSSSCSSHWLSARMRGATAPLARPSLFFSATSISTPPGCAARSGNAVLGVGVRQRADWRTDRLSEMGRHLGIQCAGLGQPPSGLAKSRTWRGLTTTTGRDAVANAPANGSSKPPVDSRPPPMAQGTATPAPGCGSQPCRGPPSGPCPRTGGPHPAGLWKHLYLRRRLLDLCSLPVKGRPVLATCGLLSPSNCPGSAGKGAVTMLSNGLPRPR